MRFSFKKGAAARGEGVVSDGAYRLHRKEDVVRFNACAAEVFLDRALQFQCFGADWMGRQFALDQGRMIKGDPQVAILDPATGEIFEIPCGYREFHEIEMIKYPNETVEYDRFKQWLSSGGVAPKYGECIGFRVPLFLGGKDAFDNLEVVDLDVYWSISGQILAQTRDLAIGTRIGGISVS